MSDPASPDAVVRAAFERARQRPGEPYDPERFLAFLTDPPAPSGRNVRDTFAGRRRLVRFVHEVQLEVGACLTHDEWEVGYRMEDFVALMAKKSANRAATLRLARKRHETARGQRYFSAITLGLLSLPLVGGIVGVAGLLFVWLGVTDGIPRWVLVVVALLLWLPLVASLATFGWRDAEYHRRLLQRLEASEK